MGSVSAIITTISLAIALGVRSSQPQTTSPDTNTCLTPGCVQLAAQMIAGMNQSVDPCEDFYQFSCGNWENNNMIPEGSIIVTQLMKPQIPLFQNLAKLADSGNDGGVEAVRKAFTLYRSCKNATAIENLGVTPLRNLIAERLGGWPLLGIPETTPWSINSPSFFYEKNHGSFAFFSVFPFFSAVTMSRSKYALHFVQPASQLLQSSQNITAIKISFVSILLTQFNSSVNRTTADEAVQKILDFGLELNRILEPPSQVPNIVDGNDPPLLNQSNIYSFERLRTLWPGFDWQGFINYMYNLAGLNVPQDLEIVVTTPAYFQKLDALLKNTDLDVIHDYAKLVFLRSQLPRLNSAFASTRTQNDPTPGNLVSCMTFVQRALPIALARPYVEQFLPKGTKENITMMMDYILQGFRERVSQMNWLSDLSKQRSIEKINEMQQTVEDCLPHSKAAATPQQRLPSLPYTPEQLFFIAFGQSWCEAVSSPSYYQAQYSADNHAPGRVRVRTVANSLEFAEVFNCPVGSPMNPTNKCAIW